MPAKKTQYQFIQDAINIHGDKYDYSKVVYKGSKTKIIIICPEHGEFEQTPFTHIINKNGCPSCGLRQCAESRTFKDLDKFITTSNLKHDNYYDYSKVILNGVSNNVTIICPEHGEFEQIVYNHMVLGYGCQQCGYVKNSQNQPNKNTIEEFIEKSVSVHGDAYDYSLVEYYSLKTPVLLICNTCNSEFWTIPNRHISNSAGCSNCNNSARYQFYNDYPIEFYSKVGTFYVLKFKNDYEEFFKIGISIHFNTRLSQIKNSSKNKYLINLIYSKIDKIPIIAKYEYDLKIKYLNSKYVPFIKFGGHTECFTNEILREFLVNDIV